MKKQFFILSVVMFMSIMLTAQDYNHFSIKPEVGVTKIRDVTSVIPFNVGLSLRYMPNTLFGAELSGTFSRLYEDDFNFYKETYPLTYYSGALHGVINVGRLLNFESFTKHYTILSGVGGTYIYSEGQVNDKILHRLSNFHLSAFVDNEFKITKQLFINAGLDVITGVNSRAYTENSTATTSIVNFNLGVTIAFGGTKREHADWYIEEPIVNTVYMEPTIIDKTVTNNITSASPVIECNCSIQRYLYFDHNSYELTKDTREAIEYTKDQIMEGKMVTLRAYCSNVGDIDYNKRLALSRAIAVKEALIGIGVSDSRINIEAVGIDITRGENVFGFGRRVELITE